MIKFYDTNALILLQKEIFNSEDRICISNVTFKELEVIKTSGTKDKEIKWAARNILRLLAEKEGQYDIAIYKNSYEEDIREFDLPNNDDSKIIITARNTFINNGGIKSGVFITQDLSCKKLAECAGLQTDYIKPKNDNYKGYLKITLDEPELANFYEFTLVENENKYGLLNNEYLLINFEDKITDKYKWTDSEGYKKVNYNNLDSTMFGKVVPINRDDYQQCAIDSLISNKVTVMRGPAGSGKSYLALGHLMSQLEKGKISQIIVFCNTVAVRDTAKLGFYPGTRDEKLLDSQIGNLLTSKFGSIIEVEKMIGNGSLVLLPTCDIRGFDTGGLNAGIYITEAQNTTVDMMKLMLQRIGEDSITIIEGDDNAQVDMSEYAENNNGLRRLSEVFRGQDFYGEITLQNIYRSKIAKIAEAM